jgi:hypothetical protein
MLIISQFYHPLYELVAVKILNKQLGISGYTKGGGHPAGGWAWGY